MYHLTLTPQELWALAFLADRGYWPMDVYDGMTLASSLTGDTATWEIPEYLAWSILEFRDENPHAYLTCTGGTLLEKLLELEASIV